MAHKPERLLASVMFTDIVGYSALTQKDEVLALSYVEKYKRVVTEQTRIHHGETIHFYGDGSLTIYRSAVNAVECAIAIQQKLREGPVIPLRIGIHLGETVRKDESIYGNAVNIASRLHNLGIAGSVLVSESIQKQLDNHPNFNLQYIGKERVKNITEPVQVYAIQHKDIITPTWRDIRKHNTFRKQGSVFTVLAIVAVLFLLFFGDMFDNNPPEYTTERVVVMPFENYTEG